VLKGEVSCLEGISERNPEKISSGKHVAKPISRDVHDREDGRLFHASALLTQIKRFKSAYLVVNRIRDIPQMEPKDENHRICQRTTASNVLLASHTDIDECPKDQTRSEFIERLEVEGADRWVQFTADVELSHGLMGISRLDPYGDPRHK